MSQISCSKYNNVLSSKEIENYIETDIKYQQVMQL